MKRTNNSYTAHTHSHKKALPFPNAASRRNQLDRLIDNALTAVSGIGFAIGLMFLFTVF